MGVLGAALDIFSDDRIRVPFRAWGHVVVGITWIGLLYFFNFVQVPGVRRDGAGGAQQRHRQAHEPRAVVVPVGGGRDASSPAILILLASAPTTSTSGDYIKTTPGIAIYSGILLALTMFLNVWLVIWPNQQKVIANARNVQAGGEADPEAAAAGRRALLASRQNTIFSLPMLMFMVGASHFPYDITDAISPDGQLAGDLLDHLGRSSGRCSS